ncbi:MAG TPA: Holliday junction branch migration protein RuvA [Egibacteraceae bacterium]
MIAQLRGRLAAVTLGAVVVDVGGVGYLVHIPPGMPVGVVGDEVTLHTHLVVREDALTLYGFTDARSRTLFTTLLSVTGVGPKLALAALGALGAERLRAAVVNEDVAALTVVPGIGRKGAQRMILELREKLGALHPDGVPGGAAAGDGALDARGEVREALAALGYAAPEIARTLDALPADEDATAEELLRSALRALGTR